MNVKLSLRAPDDETETGARELYCPILEWQTRILAIHPGDEGTVVKADLLTADIIRLDGLGVPSLKQRVKYEALSYTWGTPGFTQPIICNNRVVAVTENLHEALVHLRQRTDKRWVWVDALCIHQTDLEEKARQIRNLQLIFQKAERVIAWLGAATPVVGTIFVIVNNIPQRPDRPYRMITYNSVETGLKFRASDLKTLLQQLSAESLKQILDGFVELLSRPWLRRA